MLSFGLLGGDLGGGASPSVCEGLVDIKAVALSVGAGWVNNGDNTYTGTATDGLINNLVPAFSAIPFSPKCSRIEILDISAGSVSGVFDGVSAHPFYDEVGEHEYLDELWGDSGNAYIIGQGFTGTIRVDQISEVTP